MSSPRVFILRGLPGSGKSTFAKALKERFQAAIVSADNFPGLYGPDPHRPTLDRRLLSQAHEECFARFMDLCRADPPGCIVVDNTNTTLAEMAPYRSVAIYYRARITIATAEASLPLSVLAERNTHGVPFSAIQNMADRWEDLPFFWNRGITLETIYGSGEGHGDG